MLREIRGTTWELETDPIKRKRVLVPLAGATATVTVKRSAADLDAAALITVTETLTASGQVTFDTALSVVQILVEPEVTGIPAGRYVLTLTLVTDGRTKKTTDVLHVAEEADAG